ncbi:MAG TPA: M50 family metallopeptidase [Polyangiaceae bacterium]|nr:M50 family metallopeptidase [Polyangiaceae bacterium]
MQRYIECVNVSYVIAGILGLALLMVVHETGHLLAARAFGMRVLRYSIGFGPALYRHRSRKSQTEYQIALIPFLAYVQVAGMNPFEEIDPDDKASYANGSLLARISVIVAGPLANYLFASVFFFAALMIGGKAIPTTGVQVMDGPAKAAKMLDGDVVQTIDGQKVADWEDLRKRVMASGNKPLSFGIVRHGQPMTLEVTPTTMEGTSKIGVGPVYTQVPVTFKEATIQSLVDPATVVENLVIGLSRIVTGREKPQLSGPVGIVKQTSMMAQRSWTDYLTWLGILSAYLGGFNLLPFPALDGGRLAFLGYEAVTRRRPNAKVEAKVHFFGLVMLLALIAVVSVFDVVDIRAN